MPSLGQKNALKSLQNTLKGLQNALKGLKNTLKGLQNALKALKNALKALKNALKALSKGSKYRKNTSSHPTFGTSISVNLHSLSVIWYRYQILTFGSTEIPKYRSQVPIAHIWSETKHR